MPENQTTPPSQTLPPTNPPITAPSTIPAQQPQQKTSTHSNAPSLKLALLMYILGVISGICLILAFPKLTNTTQPTPPNANQTKNIMSPTATPLPATPTLESSSSAIMETTPQTSPSATIIQ